MRTLRSLRVAGAPVGDIALALFFAIAAQLDVWVFHTIEGPHVTNSVLLAFVGPPVAWRRRWPCGALTVSSAAIAAQVIVVGRTPPSGLLYAGPTLIGAYSVGAWAPWSRRALAALAAMATAYDGIYAPAEGLSGSLSTITTELVWIVLPAAMWLLGHQVRRRRLAAAAAAERTRVEREHGGCPRSRRTLSGGPPASSAPVGSVRGD